MPKVTALRSGPPGRALVELDGAAWRALPHEVIARAGVTVGLELDRPLLRSVRHELRRHEALDVAARALRQRDRSAAEVRERLERKGVAEATRTEVLGALEAAGIVDDGRYAEARAAALAARGAGDIRIRWELERAGVAAEHIERAMSALEPEPERARRLIAASRDPLRTARSLARKGFSEDAVEAAVPGVVAETHSPAVRYDD